MTDKVSIGNNFKIGDTFEHNGKTYKVVEVKGENVKVEEVKRRKCDWKVPNSILKGNYYCDNCNEFVINKSNFCPHCGAEMT